MEYYAIIQIVLGFVIKDFSKATEKLALKVARELASGRELQRGVSAAYANSPCACLFQAIIRRR
jgi:hypothetical protein